MTALLQDEGTVVRIPIDVWVADYTVGGVNHGSQITGQPLCNVLHTFHTIH